MLLLVVGVGLRTLSCLCENSGLAHREGSSVSHICVCIHSSSILLPNVISKEGSWSFWEIPELYFTGRSSILQQQWLTGTEVINQAWDHLSNLHVHRNSPGILLKCRFRFGRSGEAVRSLHSNKLPSDCCCLRCLTTGGTAPPLRYCFTHFVWAGCWDVIWSNEQR